MQETALRADRRAATVRSHYDGLIFRDRKRRDEWQYAAQGVSQCLTDMHQEEKRYKRSQR